MLAALNLHSLEKVQIYPKSVKWTTLFRTNPVIILLHVNRLTLNNLHYIVLDLWKDCQTSQIKKENQNFGTVKRIFVQHVFVTMYVFVEFLGAIIHKPEYLMKGKILGTKHYPTCLIVFDPL